MRFYGETLTSVPVFAIWSCEISMGNTIIHGYLTMNIHEMFPRRSSENSPAVEYIFAVSKARAEIKVVACLSSIALAMVTET